jgi:hypothetical protein
MEPNFVTAASAILQAATTNINCLTALFATIKSSNY